MEVIVVLILLTINTNNDSNNKSSINNYKIDYYRDPVIEIHAIEIHI